MIVILLLMAMALAAPLLAPYGPYARNLANRLAPPSPQHWLGTDELGRDLLSRLIYGGHVTLGIEDLRAGRITHPHTLELRALAVELDDG